MDGEYYAAREAKGSAAAFRSYEGDARIDGARNRVEAQLDALGDYGAREQAAALPVGRSRPPGRLTGADGIDSA